MAMKRTTVYADEDDLAVIKAAAARRGVPEAELIRDAIHLAAMANRTWDGPFFSETYTPDKAVPRSRGHDALEEVWSEKAQAYEQTKRPTR